jgi:phenylalanyl-tRNA synthetase beta chain
MKIPLSWLKDFVDIDLPVEQLAERMTLAGLEVESIGRIGELWDRDKIFVGQILEVVRHPDAERLTLVRVDYGGDQPMTVVTGAPNMLPFIGQDLSSGKGPKVAYALSGARLIDGHSEERKVVRLKPSKIRGVVSEGMVCSEKELDLSDSHEGNLVLPPDAPVGMPLVDYMGDVVLDYDVKGAFGHLQCVYGAAREVAALTGRPLRREVMTILDRNPVTITPEADFAAIVIDAPDLCLRYSAALIEGVQIGPSPLWMQQRLQRAGMRPINNVVDITNYVMLELGQPLHAFDHDLLVQRAAEAESSGTPEGVAQGGLRQGGHMPHIIMRRAEPGERMRTLDGVDRELDPGMLMITDTAGAIAVAGVMGGAETEVSEATSRILLESANFDFLSIRRTSQLLGLRSEAASRFGKRVDPELTVKALARACQLLEELAGGRARPVYCDNYPGRPEPKQIELDPSYANRLLGIDMPAAEMVRILEALEFTVDRSGACLSIGVPSHRQDVNIPADVVEELGRVYGYDRFPSTLMDDELPRTQRNVSLEGEEKVRDVLVGCGLDEAITYSMIDLRAEAKLCLPPAAHVTVLNPLSSERSHLRVTLLPALIETAQANHRFGQRVAIFELGRVYLPQPEQELPAEPRRLALLLAGPREEDTWLKHDAEPLGFFDLKGVLETLLARLGLREVTWERPAEGAQHPSLHPGRTARILVGGAEVGMLGELHPQVRAAFDLPDLPVAVAELDVEALLAGWGAKQALAPFSAHPAVFEDLALLVDEAVPAAHVANLIRQSGGKLLAGVRLFDVYRGGQVPAGKKSLAYSLTFQAPDRTLTTEDTAKARQKITARLERELGATLRT